MITDSFVYCISMVSSLYGYAAILSVHRAYDGFVTEFKFKQNSFRSGNMSYNIQERQHTRQIKQT